ncbi:MAG TPA: glycosyltransferase family A protein [Opitutaceae bacterium]|jgi:glycosyltransferase involved in cell wall biosynthesis
MDSNGISIVIPTHGGRFLEAAVASVREQTVSNWELIIVDDGSTDGTALVAASLAAGDRRIRVVTQANTGIANARNRGLAAISPRGGYVGLLDHDDVWMPDTLASLREALAARPSASAAHGIATTIDERGAPYIVLDRGGLPRRLGVVAGQVVSWPLDRPTEFANFAYDDCVTSVGSGLVRRSALDQIGGFDPLTEPADDYDFWARLSRVGEIVFLNRTVLAYRVHPTRTSVSARRQRGLGTPYVRHKLITSPENTPEQRRTALTGFRQYQTAQLAKRWSRGICAWRSGHYSAARGHLISALSHLLQRVRGRPMLG